MRDRVAKRCSLAFVGVSVLVVAIVLGGCGGGNSYNNQQNNPQSPSLGATVDGVVQPSMQQTGVPGITVALAKNGSMLYVQGYGVTDLTTHQPTPPATVFEIGSITKQFTAALIMKLQEQGKLHVDDSIAGYLPEYTFPSAITLRMLLTHTSGLADYTNFPQLGDWVKNGVAESTVLNAVSQAPLVFQPGTQYSYSNSGYFALGTIIEKLTGQSYAANLNQVILQPLGLQNSFYMLPPANSSATGYTNNGMGLVPAILWDRSAAFAAGALSSNVYDLVTWDAALMNGKVVSPASFQAMTTSNGFTDSKGNSYGFGLALYKYNGRPIMWHAGQIGGFYTESVVFLDSGFNLIVLTNDQDVNTDPLVFSILNAVCNSTQLSGNC